MKKSETAQILALIGAAYSRFDVPQKKDSLKFMTWHKMLKDFDFQLTQTAVEKLIAECKFPPSIADIREQVADVKNFSKNRLTAGEAWEKAIKAVNKFSSHRGYGYKTDPEVIDQLPDLVVKTAEMIGWNKIGKAKAEGVVRGQFMKMYKQVQDRDKKESVLPSSVRDKMEKLESNAVNEIEDMDNVVKLGSGS